MFQFQFENRKKADIFLKIRKKMNNNDQSVIVLTDENGEFVVKGKNHPDNIITVNLSDEESDPEPVTSTGQAEKVIKLDKIRKKFVNFLDKYISW